MAKTNLESNNPIHEWIKQSNAYFASQPGDDFRPVSPEEFDQAIGALLNTPVPPRKARKKRVKKN